MTIELNDETQAQRVCDHTFVIFQVDENGRVHTVCLTAAELRSILEAEGRI